MIEKMAYVHVTGPKPEFDRVTENYLCDYDIHLENAVLQLEGQSFISLFNDADPYKELLAKAEELGSFLPAPEKKKGKLKERRKSSKSLSRDEACSLVIELYEGCSKGKSRRGELEKETELLRDDLESILPFRELPYRIESILDFKYVTYRFGRVPKGAYNYYRHTRENHLSNIFIECKRDDNYVWGVYFVPENEESKVDSIFASLQFERVKLKGSYTGTPDEICSELEKRIAANEKEMADIDSAAAELVNNKSEDFYAAKEKLAELEHNFDARKLAAVIESENETETGTTPFFLLCGWMRVKDAVELKDRIEKNEKEVLCIVDFYADTGLNPPTSIKNIGIFKPYEMYVKMYGLPAYNEFDPTMIVALLYSFIFGAMFGDLGHGLCLLIGGAALYFIKRSQLAGIISFAGFFSCIFGLLYGSFFGFEDIIPTLWLKPREAMSTLNFIGRLNTVFAIAVLFGMLLMLALMLLNVASHIKQKNFRGSIFTSNGIAGFLFYGTVVLVVVLYMTDRPLPATIIIIALIVISVLMMALNEPLTNLLNRRKALEGGVGMFLVEAFFDLFETILSYFSNTLSFVRVGAFAVSHAAMMEVVLSLGGYTEGGNGSIAVLIIGNIFVMGFEGLIVGIQVLRLQYYEIFSKFYKGDGREFRPFFKRRNS